MALLGPMLVTTCVRSASTAPVETGWPSVHGRHSPSNSFGHTHTAIIEPKLPNPIGPAIYERPLGFDSGRQRENESSKSR